MYLLLQDIQLTVCVCSTVDCILSFAAKFYINHARTPTRSGVQWQITYPAMTRTLVGGQALYIRKVCLDVMHMNLNYYFGCWNYIAHKSATWPAAA